MNVMTELAIQADRGRTHEDVDVEKQKEAIALCNRRIEAAVYLFKDGEIDRTEYLRIREANEREIAHWQSRTTETRKLAIELAMCVEAVDKLSRLWAISLRSSGSLMAHSLFECLVYDLDAQRITDFRLKPWADRFLLAQSDLIDPGDKGKMRRKEAQMK
jgi:hypothetical protein